MCLSDTEKHPDPFSFCSFIGVMSGVNTIPRFLHSPFTSPSFRHFLVALTLKPYFPSDQESTISHDTPYNATRSKRPRIAASQQGHCRLLQYLDANTIITRCICRLSYQPGHLRVLCALENIRLKFKYALHVRHQAPVVPFLMGANFRT